LTNQSWKTEGGYGRKDGEDRHKGRAEERNAKDGGDRKGKQWKNGAVRGEKKNRKQGNARKGLPRN
jgi:hypothetical protein